MVEFTEKDLDVFISEQTLQKRITELGEAIVADYGPNPEIHVIAVLKGSFVFLADLVRAIKSDRLTVDFLGLSSYGDSTSSSGVVQLTKDLSMPIAGLHVLIVEDIIDTGLTMNYLLHNLQTRNPKSLEVCTLLHKRERTIETIPLRYVGFEVPDRFVIGYGLDYAQRYRNLPFIGVVNSVTEGDL